MIGSIRQVRLSARVEVQVSHNPSPGRPGFVDETSKTEPPRSGERIWRISSFSPHVAAREDEVVERRPFSVDLQYRFDHHVVAGQKPPNQRPVPTRRDDLLCHLGEIGGATRGPLS